MRRTDEVWWQVPERPDAERERIRKERGGDPEKQDSGPPVEPWNRRV